VELRSKPVLTAVGKAECLRPYSLCDRCHRGQFPIDVELDIENTELSPGVRRVLAMVGQQGLSTKGASKWSCWQVYPSPPRPWSALRKPSEPISKCASSANSNRLCN